MSDEKLISEIQKLNVTLEKMSNKIAAIEHSVGHIMIAIDKIVINTGKQNISQ